MASGSGGGVDYSPLVQGGADIGTGIRRAIEGYMALKQQDASSTGQIEAYLKNSVSQTNPDGTKGLSDDGQKLIQKFTAGNASRKDKIQLLGEISTGTQMKQTAVDQAHTKAESTNLLADALKNSTGAEHAAMVIDMFKNPQRYFGGNQGGQPNGAAGAGSPAPDPATLSNLLSRQGPNDGPGAVQPVGGAGQLNPPQQPQAAPVGPPRTLTLDDPDVQQQMPQYLKMAMGDPDKASTLLQQNLDQVNKNTQTQYQQRVDATSPTGNFGAFGPVYKDGILQGTKWRPQIIKGKGTQAESMSFDPKGEIITPPGADSPGPLVDQAGRQLGAHPADPRLNTNDPVWQKEVADAYTTAAGSSVTLGKAKQLQDAAEAYTSGSTGRWNSILGDPKFKGIVQMFKGTNPLNAFQIALAANTQSILGQIRSSNGSVGGRILQNEYENSAKVLASPDMDNNAILAASRNIYKLADRQNTIDSAYAKYRETMPAGEAEKLATQQFGRPPQLEAGVAPAPLTAPPGGPPAQAGGMVSVVSPDGKPGKIPQANLQQALAAGYKTQ